ncbi:MAG: 3'(2'),5'-bisphosphate nucleotidase CysQ [Hyphomicrobiaceae bacterium]
MIHELELAAMLAGEEIVRVKQRVGTTATTKADGSPVSAADEAAEVLILERLERLFPDIPIVAEERVAAGRIPSLDDLAEGRFFLVDPLDGTREFVAGRTEYTVNIALIERGTPVAGVVVVPEEWQLFSAVSDHSEVASFTAGAAVDERQRLRVRVAGPSPLALVSRSHLTPETNTWLARRRITQTTDAGSSLKFCRIAAGQADVYPRLGPTSQWDTAAGDAVLRGAGGKTTTLDGAPLAYVPRDGSAKARFLNPNFVASGLWDDPTAAMQG